MSLSDLFDNIGVISTNHLKDVPIDKTMVCVHEDDLEPMSVIEADWGRGPWIAGGAALRWYQGKPIRKSDIDIFCKSPKQVQEVIERIKSWGRCNEKFDSENALTLEYYRYEPWTTWNLQIIKHRFYNSPQEVIDAFDLGVCRVATDGHHWLLGQGTAQQIRRKELVFKEPLAPDALKRLLKYTAYGYRASDEQHQAILDNPESIWDFEFHSDYDHTA